MLTSALRMNSRSNVVITSLFLCHLFLIHGIVTGQLPSATPSNAATQECIVNTFTKPRPGRNREPVTIKAVQCEKTEDVFKLHGQGEIDFRSYVIRGDEMAYDQNSGEVTGNGHLRLDGGPYDQHIEASHGTYNVESEKGTFYNVYGTTGMRFKGKNVILTTSNPFAFTGRVVEKVSPTRLIVHHGTVTSCQLPKPKWTFNAERVVVDIGGTAKIYNSTFRVRKIPTFYFPFAAHPVEKVARQTGLLVPVIGQSSSKGFILGDSFYWAINRSMDAEIGAEYMSKRGYGQRGYFRAKPDPSSFFDVNYFGVLDRRPPSQNQGGEDVRLNGETLLFTDVRSVASVEYLSSYTFRQAYSETFAQAVNSEVNSIVFLARNGNGFFYDAEAAKYQNFQSSTPGDLITLFHAPGLEASSIDRRIAASSVYWGFDAAAEGLSRRSPGFNSADLVARLDIHPRISVPLFLRGWTFRPTFAARDTYYTQSQLLVGSSPVATNDDVNRRALEAGFELRPPTLVKVFDKPFFGRKVKHTLEPQISYSYVNGIDNFNRIIRFDYRDIASDANAVEFSLMNRVYFKRPGSKCPEDSVAEASSGERRDCATRAREFISWKIAEQYYFSPTFGGAVVTGTRNVFTTTEELTGIAFVTQPRRFSPIVSRLRLHPTERTSVQWDLDYDFDNGRINASDVFLDYHLGNYFLGGSQSILKAPGEAATNPASPSSTVSNFDQFRLLAGYGSPGKRGFSIAAGAGYDLSLHAIQYSAVQTSYNWDCCGLSFEYRRLALGATRNENQFRFAFNIANVGTFGTMKRQERLF
jgi:LPS-assembly protein